jgi:hypothetical protein
LFGLLIETSGSRIGTSPCADRGDTWFRGQIDNRAHFGAKDASLGRTLQQRVETWDQLHQLNTIGLGLKPLVDLQEGDDTAILPQKCRHRLALDLPVHRRLEQDGPDHFGAGEGRGGHDPHPHLVHQPKHLRVTAVGAVGNAIQAQGAGGGPAALVKCRDEATLGGHLRHHRVIGHGRHPPLRSALLA